MHITPIKIVTTTKALVPLLTLGGVGRGAPAFPEGAPVGWAEPPDPIMRKTIVGVSAAGALAFACFFSAAPAIALERPVPATPAAVAVYSKVLHRINPQMPGWQSRDLARRVLVNAERWRLDANMLVAVVTVESRWHTHAVSSAGALGLGQLMPGTAAKLGVNPLNPVENLSGAARYLSGLVHRFGTKNYDLVFAAYNAGPHAVTQYGGVPPYNETVEYVARVLDAWQNISRSVRIPASAYVAKAHGLDVDYWLDAVQ